MVYISWENYPTGFSIFIEEEEGNEFKLKQKCTKTKAPLKLIALTLYFESNLYSSDLQSDYIIVPKWPKKYKLKRSGVGLLQIFSKCMYNY